MSKETHHNEELAEFTNELYRQPSLVEGPIQPEPYRRFSTTKQQKDHRMAPEAAPVAGVEDEEDDELDDQVIEVLGSVRSPLSPPNHPEKNPIGIQVASFIYLN